MDVLIKGLEMPKKEKGCSHIIYLYADGTVVTGGKVYMAVPVPPHGRLIDADALTDDLDFDVKNDQRFLDELKKDSPDEFTDIKISTTQDDKDIKQNCIVLLREQPTIIEASERKEE